MKASPLGLLVSLGFGNATEIAAIRVTAQTAIQILPTGKHPNNPNDPNTLGSSKSLLNALARHWGLPSTQCRVLRNYARPAFASQTRVSFVNAAHISRCPHATYDPERLAPVAASSRNYGIPSSRPPDFRPEMRAECGFETRELYPVYPSEGVQER